jgi:ankyrin repeat protein
MRRIQSGLSFLFLAGLLFGCSDPVNHALTFGVSMEDMLYPPYNKGSNEDAVYLAISRNDLPRVKQFLAKGVPINNSVEESYGSTPLGVAAYYGRYEIAKYLIEQGANANLSFRGERGAASASNPLLRAIWKKHNNVAVLLLEHGADPKEKSLSYPYKDACQFAKSYNNFQIMAHLSKCS